MFFKLIKYDINYSKDMFLSISAIGIGLAIILRFMTAINPGFGISFLDILSALVGVTISLGIFIVGIISFIQIVQFYNRNFFSDSGYLTLTLPYKRWQLLLSKFIVSTIWYNLIMLTVIIIMFILDLLHFSSINLSWFSISTVIMAVLYINIVGLLLYSVLFFALTLGNSVIINKKVSIILSIIITAIAFTFLLYFVEPILNYAFNQDWANIAIASRTIFNPFFYNNELEQIVYFNWLVIVFASIVFYGIFMATNYILKNKISLK